jgi:hypothetical protein
MEKGVTVKQQKPSRDAFEWFALNDSGGLEDPANWPLWDEWRHTPGNKAKYLAVLQFLDQLRKLPAPEAARREDLVEDAAKDESSSSDGPLTH